MAAHGSRRIIDQRLRRVAHMDADGVTTTGQGACWHCGAAVDAADYGRGDTCRACGRDTRVCRNCGFYDPALYNECHETQAERVVDKERANFCDFFRARHGRGGGRSASRPDPAEAARNLFK